jgi:hypothetical protein
MCESELQPQKPPPHKIEPHLCLPTDLFIAFLVYLEESKSGSTILPNKLFYDSKTVNHLWLAGQESHLLRLSLILSPVVNLIFTTIMNSPPLARNAQEHTKLMILRTTSKTNIVHISLDQKSIRARPCPTLNI